MNNPNLNKIIELASQLESGNVLREKIVKGVYDFSVQGGAQGTYSLGVELPIHAVVTRSYVDVLATVLPDSAVLGVGSASDADIVAASAAGSVFEIGQSEGVQTGTAASMLKMTAKKTVYVKIATDDVTAGKFNVFIEYLNSE